MTRDHPTGPTTETSEPEHGWMKKTGVSRRTYLKGGGLALVGLLGTVAGCSTLWRDDDMNTTTTATTRTRAATTTETTSTDSETKTESRESNSPPPIPALATKIPTPPDPLDVSFSYSRYDLLRDRQRESDGSLSDLVGENETYPGAGGFEIPYTDIDTVLLADVDVVTGSFENEPIITTIQQRSDAALQEEYKGYEIYVEPDHGSANAFSDETLISDILPDPSLTELKATIDVMNGDGERFYDANDDFKTLVNALGTGFYVFGNLSSDNETEDVRNDVGRGVAFRATGGTVTLSAVVVFDDADAADSDAVRESFMNDVERRNGFTNPDDVTVEQTGRVVTLSGEANLEQSNTPTPSTTETPTNTETSSELELSPLVPYTNDAYAYQIEHPNRWTVNDTIPQQIEIANQDGDGIRITVFEQQYASNTVGEVADIAITNTREAVTEFELLDRQKTTLESGQSAVIIDVTYDSPSDTANLLRSYILFAKQGDVVYQVEFVADAVDWTPAVERGARRIVESFTLSENTATVQRALAFVHGW